MGFLDHLAGMALGAKTASAARPSLAPRFAPPSLALGDAQQALEVVEQAQPARASVARDPALPTLSAPRSGPPVVPAPVPVRAEEPSAQEPARVAPRQPHLLAPETRLRPPDVVRHASPAASNPAAPLHPAPRGEAAQPPRLLPETPAEPTGMRAAPTVVHAASTVTRAAPISEAMIAGAPMAVRAQGPVIHVTIERLEVRAAPAKAAAAPPPRPRPQPAVSLSDYLREGARGVRP